ncbi:hypothetical protein HZC21_01615 [Candidatus Peregrinibacteria bacterium]|nr:hypothetical protein [Candidatus Peregrinibacteria bacterium]
MQNSTALEKLSDKELFARCQMYGRATLMWRQKFIGLLPEIYRRRLFEKKDFSSIFEFAAKLAGISEEQVGRVLNLEKRLQDKSELHNALVNGEISINKLRRIVPIATQENQKFLLEQIKILPQKAIETFVRDEQYVGRAPISNEQSSMLQPPSPEPELSDETKYKLYELQQKGIDINELILEAIRNRGQKIAEEKEKLATESARAGQTVSRHIPEKIKKILKEEHGEKCSISTCQKPAKIIHHMQRFSLSQNHDPRFLAPLCKEHHVIAHSVDIKYRGRMRG